MKRIIYLLVAMTSLLTTSCTPTTPVTPSTNNTAICPQPKLQFKGNGIMYVCDAIPDSRFGWAGYSYIIDLNSTTGSGFCLFFMNYKSSFYSYGTPNWYVNFPATQNKVSGKFDWYAGGTTQPNITIDGLSFNEDTYHYELVPNSIILNITSITNGLASGTFSGTIPAVNIIPNHGPQMNITDGIFSNIPVFE